jgi:D-3-phosphoglycerate dehydrogenase / 2-oxoglutarate reductase
MPRVLITDSDLGDSALETSILEERLSAEVRVDQLRTEAEVIGAVADYQPDALLVQWAPITRAVFEAATRLKVIGRFGIGIDMIDVQAASEHGVAVHNVPDYCIEEVATHAVALGLALWRRLPAFDAQVRAGTPDVASAAGGIGRLSEATIGLVGLGRIGRRVAQAFEVWGARIIVTDPVAGHDGYDRVSLPQQAREADLISLHAPLLPDTYHLIDTQFLDSCQRRPYLVNTSRGGLVDSAAVAAALRDGRLAGAGLDVFESEPLPADDPLQSAPNVMLTPHAAWCSAAALPELRRRAALAVADHLSS